MEKIFRKVRFLSGCTYNINVVLSETFTLIGNYSSDENSDNVGDSTNVNITIITGTSESRLSEIETFDLQFPYKIGINGVTDINYNSDGTVNFVEYNIDGIDYKTFLTTLNTTYSYQTSGINNINGETFSLIKEDTLLGINEIPEVDNNINVDRQEISVFEPHYRLRNIKNLGDLETIGGGNVFNIVKSN